MTMPAANAPQHHNAHAEPIEALFERLASGRHGLPLSEVAPRQQRYGYNELPKARPAGPLRMVLRQFRSPLIYLLLVAAVISFGLGHYSDAGFILFVLLLNALIGAAQEYSAQRSALALQQLVTTYARVERGGDSHEIDARELVPGDVVWLEEGNKIPADLRLFDCRDLQIDESLLTGESQPVAKQSDVLRAELPLAERRNMAYAGTMTSRGRGRGVVVAIAGDTEIGRLASAVTARDPTKPPLLVRMERFTVVVALFVTLAAVALAAVALAHGSSWGEVLLLTVALAVSAIPEGLPVALTVALAIGMNRMARRNVIVRKLVAVEALGSCTFIASDKTGTLTINQLTARRLVIPGHGEWEITGEGAVPEGTFLRRGDEVDSADTTLIEAVCRSMVLNNEGYLGQRDERWVHHGDAVDVALLVMAHKAGVVQGATQSSFAQLATIPFEAANRFSATLNRHPAETVVHVKGAIESLLPMCGFQAGHDGPLAIDRNRVEAAAEALAREGYRVIALASGPWPHAGSEPFAPPSLTGLTLLGLVALNDPLRSEAKEAVARCRAAGIAVSMITGDHPVTALSIARELGMAEHLEQVVTGSALRHAAEQGEAVLDALTRTARVFARVEPQQKLDIVRSLTRNGHFVAVTGDGANDAPALRAAHVGIAMGKGGTDVARETAELVLTDDNFNSIVNGIEEGRIAYANVRKVIFLLISTGAAELVLFALAMLSGLPLPLLPVQLLWLNLVTNGIQDVALAFEPAEGNELRQPPRPPRERIFNRVMIERVALSAVTVGLLAFLTFQWLLGSGYSVEEARNGTLLLMVLFENIQVFNSRSETRLALTMNPLDNRLLLFGTAIAQLIHIGAMYTPGLNTLLAIQPVSPLHWLQLLGVALGLLLVMELYKGWRRF